MGKHRMSSPLQNAWEKQWGNIKKFGPTTCAVLALAMSAFLVGGPTPSSANETTFVDEQGLICVRTDFENGGMNLVCKPQPGTPSPTPTSSSSPTPSATPSATESPTSSPSPSPTVTPSPTAPPSPTTTPSPSASPTSSPSPTTSPTQTTNCMPVPSACGWPDATNTGTTGSLGIVPNDVTLSTAGMVYENRDVRGCITVRAVGVIIRNVKITCSADYAIAVNTGPSSNRWNSPNANLLVDRVDINMAGQLDGKAIAFDGYTLRRAHIHGGSDCGHFGENVVIEDTFCEIPAGGPQDGPHYDGYQSDGGRNIRINHNTIRVPYSQTSAILMSTNTSPIRDVTITNNLVAGGGYSIYCGTGQGGPVLGSFTFSGNVVARTYFPNGGFWGPETECPASGWRWDS